MMKGVRSKLFMLIAGVALAGGLGLLSTKSAWAQADPRKLAAIKATADSVRAFAESMPEDARQLLSSGALNLIGISERWNQIEPLLRQASPGGALPPPSRKILAPKNVSDPADDTANLLKTAFGGWTQNETSTAWCGKGAVVGFNDTGSFVETVFSGMGPGGRSFNGVATSNNADTASPTYTDRGFLNPSANTNFTLNGDPVVACTNPSTFYYASLLTDIVDPSDNTDDRTCISVSKSTDGGATFGDPVKVICKKSRTPDNKSFHLLDKEWMAVDPTNAMRIFVVYTDFDMSGNNICGLDTNGNPILRTKIELKRSTDGGATWPGSPLVIREVCQDTDGMVQGAQVAVGPDTDGTPANVVYVAYEFFPSTSFVTREIDIHRSNNAGTSFGAPVKVDDVTLVGFPFIGSALQGLFRSFFEVPSLAVNRTGGATRGDVYIVWNDGRNFISPPNGYRYADVFFSRSTDGGATWSPAIKVNNNAEPLPSGLGTDQYQPSIAVDNSATGAGKLGVCWYDRRRDKKNFRIDRFCATSTNNGDTWTNMNITPGTRRNWSPVPTQDLFTNFSSGNGFFSFFTYMGDYDTTATDFRGPSTGNSGFITTWGDNLLGNPDVKADKLP